LLLIPVSIECPANIIISVMRIKIPASMVTILLGITPIFMNLLSIPFFKTKLGRRQYIAMSSGILGVIALCVNCLYNKNFTDFPGSDIQLIAILSISLAFFLIALSQIIEQKLFENFFYLPSEMAGIKGLFGLIISFLVVIICCSLPCQPGPILSCVWNPETQLHTQESIIIFIDMVQSSRMLIINFSIILVLWGL